MYLRLLQVDDFVKVNKLKEVKDPIYLQFKRPTPEGLFSYEIFGITQYDRQSIWGYIDLGSRFLHPLAAINFKKYGAIYENIIYGIKNYRFANGEFIEDPNGDTGIDFLYENYDNIKWRETPSLSSTERINFLKQGKDKLFITKFPVSPPYYRDINDNSVVGVNKVNELYKKVISQSIALKSKSSFMFFSHLTKANIQKTLVDIFDHYMKMVKGKTGIMRKSVMGRNIDYGAWCVLSAPVIDCERYTDMQVDFDHLAVPLASVLGMFKPFILQGCKEYFANMFIRKGRYPTIIPDPKTGEPIKVALTLIDPLSDYSDDVIDKHVASFIDGHSTRFEPITIPRNKEGIEGYVRLSGVFGTSKEISSRPMTWTDLFYIVAEQAIRDKSLVWSRYPIEHFYSVEYPKITIASTITTIEAVINNVKYKRYPLVEVGKDSSAAFVNTISPNNVNIGSLGADYDGDSTPIRGLFSAEANIDVEKFRRDKKNFLDLNGNLIRHTERDFVQILYSLTKEPLIELKDPNVED